MTTNIYTKHGSLLTGSVTTQGTAVPVLTERVIKSAQLCNTTAAPVACTVHIIESGGAASAANMFISAKSIAAGETYNCPELVGQGMDPGGFVQAFGLNVTFKYTAVEIV